MSETDQVPLVLAVDDEPDVLELIDYRLSHSGFNVVTARDGKEALALATERAPDLVVLDVMMPGLDGLEVTRRLRADRRTSRIPVILLTAKVQEPDVSTGFGAGADDYVKKPFNPNELVSRVRAVLARG